MERGATFLCARRTFIVTLGSIHARRLRQTGVDLMTDQEQVAAFLANRGATRAAPGVSALNYSCRDWHNAVRGERIVRVDLIEERHVTYDGRGVGHVTNGLGEYIGTV